MPLKLSASKIAKDPLLLVREATEPLRFTPPIIGSDVMSLIVGITTPPGFASHSRGRKRKVSEINRQLSFASDAGVALEDRPPTSNFFIPADHNRWNSCDTLGLDGEFRLIGRGKRQALEVCVQDNIPLLAARWSVVQDLFGIDSSVNPFEQYERPDSNIGFEEFLARMEGHLLEWEHI